MRVAINGMGIAGPTLAYWLRRSGHDPVLFEKAPAVRSGGYLIDFWGLGYEIAERMGIISTLREHSFEMERLRMVDRDGREEAHMNLAPLYEAQRGRFISIARADLASALVGACQGIPAHFNVSISAIARDGAHSIVTLSDGRQDRFDLIVGADGLHSQVRALSISSTESSFSVSDTNFMVVLLSKTYRLRLGLRGFRVRPPSVSRCGSFLAALSRNVSDSSPGSGGLAAMRLNMPRLSPWLCRSRSCAAALENSGVSPSSRRRIRVSSRRNACSNVSRSRVSTAFSA